MRQTENPLKGYTMEELQSFFNELEDFQTMHMSVLDNNCFDDWDGILTDEGMGIIRALYVCVLKFYKEHGIEIPQKISLDIPEENQSDFISFIDSREAPEFYDEAINMQITGDGLELIYDINMLSHVDGIGDFEAVNGAEGYGAYVLPSTVLGDVYGEDWEYVVAEDSELTDEELKNLDAPVEIAMMFSEAEEEMEYYLNNVIDMRVIKSEKIGKIFDLITIPKGMSRDTFLSCEPLLLRMFQGLDYLNELQEYYLSQYCLDTVKGGVWYSATICADIQEDCKVVTMLGRVPGLIGYAWFVQEVADRVLDGRIAIPQVTEPVVENNN